MTETAKGVRIRPGTADDLMFIEEMLFEAFFWRPNQLRPDYAEFIQRPEIARFLDGWGKPGDTAVIAERSSSRIGAAWYRFGTEQEHGYGYVDEETPELGIGVRTDFRSRGIGRKLLSTLIATARDQDVGALSLSVEPDNFARRLYESEGFVRVGESGTSWTFILNLS